MQDFHSFRKNKMILLALICLITNILAQNHQYQDYYDIDIKQRIKDHDYLINNNFSEDEISAINGYKRADNSHHSARNSIFDSRWFDNRRILRWISNIINTEKTTPRNLKYEDIVNDKLFYVHLTRNLTESVTKLTNTLELFTKELKKKSIINYSRSARSIHSGNVTFKTDEILNKSVNIHENGQVNIDATHQTEVGTETIIERLYNTSRRRSFDFRQLIASINDTLNVIKFEINSASNLKEVFGDKLLYNVGFISGSLTAIKGMVDEIQGSLVNNIVVLDMQYLLYLYDSVNQIKDGSGRMLEKLRAYVERAMT